MDDFEDNHEEEEEEQECDCGGHHHRQQHEKRPLQISQHEQEQLRLATQWVAEAEAVLIMAGAGMSVDSGNDDATPEGFQRLWPAMVKRGFRTLYDCIGMDFHANPRLAWGYWAPHIQLMRYDMPPHQGYYDLLELVKNKEYFVVSSNVDGMFVRSGFDENMIYTPQGEFKYLQCLTPCTRKVYQSKPYIERAIAKLDRETQELTDDSVVPRCENCGGLLIWNARVGDNYLHDPYDEEQEKFIRWVHKHKEAGTKVAVIEIGAGFVSPIVIRYPSESIVNQLPNSKLIRINLTNPQVPMKLYPRALAFPMSALNAMAELLTRKNTANPTSIIDSEKQMDILSSGYYTKHPGPPFGWEEMMEILKRR